MNDSKQPSGFSKLADLITFNKPVLIVVASFILIITTVVFKLLSVAEKTKKVKPSLYEEPFYTDCISEIILERNDLSLSESFLLDKPITLKISVYKQSSGKEILLITRAGSCSN